VCYELNETEPLAELYAWSYLRSSQHDKARVDSLGIDLLGAQHRSRRRDLITQIVRQNLHGPTQTSEINDFVKSHVENTAQEKFLSDLQFDLDELAPYRIAGMGLTQDELTKWLLGKGDKMMN